MDKSEFLKIKLMLETYFATTAKKKTSVYWEGAFIALEPYSYEDVRMSVLKYVRTNKFFPDIADITADLTPPEEKCSADRDHSWMRPYCEAMKAERMRKLQEQNWI